VPKDASFQSLVDVAITALECAHEVRPEQACSSDTVDFALDLLAESPLAESDEYQACLTPAFRTAVSSLHAVLLEREARSMGLGESAP